MQKIDQASMPLATALETLREVRRDMVESANLDKEDRISDLQLIPAEETDGYVIVAAGKGGPMYWDPYKEKGWKSIPGG